MLKHTLSEDSHVNIRCLCGFNVFDGEVVRCRVLRVFPTGVCQAKCRCKRWVKVPLALQIDVRSAI